jgi:hypothetical protein
LFENGRPTNIISLFLLMLLMSCAKTKLQNRGKPAGSIPLFFILCRFILCRSVVLNNIVLKLKVNKLSAIKNSGHQQVDKHDCV